MSPPEQSTEYTSRPGDDDRLPTSPDVEVTMPKDPAAGTAPSSAADNQGSKESELASAVTSDACGESQTNAQDGMPTTKVTETPGPPRPTTPTPASEGKEVQRDPDDTENGSSSVATLKPSDKPSSADTQYLAPESSSYVDPTPPTPTTSHPPSRAPSNAARSQTSDDHSPTTSDAGYDEKRYTSEDEQEGGSRSEIQSIMEQFSEVGGGPGEEEVMSPRLEIASPMLGSPQPQHPPRNSSLEPLAPSIAGQLQNLQVSTDSLAKDTAANDQSSEEHAPPVPPKDGSSGTPPRAREERASNIGSPTSPSVSVHRPPPPEPEPEPALPFDFHRFLEQLRNKKADPVARYLKSFLSEFGKKQWMVHEQVKIISDFLAFIANKMAQCEVWRDVPDAEFDNAREGMEKLVMNRLYSQTFSPAIPAPKPIPGAKPKRKGGDPPLGPGRRGQHQEDVERDDILTQKINIYGWLREEHLDIPQIGDSGRRFLKLAQQELLKIKSYRAPRDKIICVLNCCKVIFGLLKHNKSDSSADSFMPMLIYVVLQSNPEHLVSNVQYILRFRNQEKLGGEAGYYLSSLMGVVQFIENMDRTTLTITDEEFEKNVEAAVSAIAEKHQATSPTMPQQSSFNEKASRHLSEKVPGRSFDSPSQPFPPRSTSLNDGGASNDETVPISGLLKTIQKPLSTIGRMFTDDGGQSSTQEPGPAPRLSEGLPPPSRDPDAGEAAQRPGSRHTLSAEEAAARQASAEAAEAQRLHRAEHANVVETLSGMFPDLDKEVISDVVHQKQGRVGLAVDACLALSA